MSGTLKTGAVIVAAGMSSRMGAYKPMLRVGSVSMSQHIVSTLRKAGAEPIVVVTGHAADLLEDHLSGQELVFLRNRNYRATQMFDSAKIGLEYLCDKCEQILFTPVDIPLFKEPTVYKLLQSGAKIACPVFEGRKGHPLLIASELVPEILSDQGEGGLKGAINRLKIPVTEVPVMDIGIVYDADTPSDYEKIMNIYKNTKPGS